MGPVKSFETVTLIKGCTYKVNLTDLSGLVLIDLGQKRQLLEVHTGLLVQSAIA